MKRRRSQSRGLREVRRGQYENDDEREDDDEDAEKYDGDHDLGDGVTILISAIDV